MNWFKKKDNVAGEPDFLCVGMQKAGTKFLFDTLATTPGIRMPPCKEIHYFDDLPRARDRGRKILKEIARSLGQVSLSDSAMLRFYNRFDGNIRGRRNIRFGRHREPLDQATVQFLRAYSRFMLEERDDSAYLALFAPYSGALTGDVTPAYSTLEPAEIERVRRLLPRARILLCVRDPVSRLWSQVNMQMRREFHERYERLPSGASDLAVLEKMLDCDRLSDLLGREHFLKRSFVTRTFHNWSRVYGADNLMVIHFDDLIRRTEAVFDKLLRFIGIEQPVAMMVPGNKKGAALKIELSPERRARLELVLGEEVNDFDALFTNHGDRT